MEIAIIRQQLREYIEMVSDKKVEGLYLFVADEINKKHFSLTDNQVNHLDSIR